MNDTKGEKEGGGSQRFYGMFNSTGLCVRILWGRRMLSAYEALFYTGFGGGRN